MRTRRDFAEMFMLGPFLHSGWNRKRKEFEIQYLLYKLSERNTLNIRSLTAIFNQEVFCGDNNHHVTNVTNFCTLKRCHITTKVIEKWHIKQNSQ